MSPNLKGCPLLSVYLFAYWLGNGEQAFADDNRQMVTGKMKIEQVVMIS